VLRTIEKINGEMSSHLEAIVGKEMVRFVNYFKVNANLHAYRMRKKYPLTLVFVVCRLAPTTESICCGARCSLLTQVSREAPSTTVYR
jgi:hypothetical protein